MVSVIEGEKAHLGAVLKKVASGQLPFLGLSVFRFERRHLHSLRSLLN